MEHELNDKQRQIMEKALEVFAEKGFDSASVRDIAQRAEVNVAMISYYFGSKEKLLEAIFKKYTGFMTRKIEEIIHSTTLAPFEKVDLLIDTYVNIIIEHKTFHKVMMREQVLLTEGPLFAYIREMKLNSRNLIEIAVKVGQKTGVFQKQVDAGMLAVTLIGTVNHFFSNHKYVCGETKLKSSSIEDYDIKAIEKLRSHIKTMFKAFLTYGISNKK